MKLPAVEHAELARTAVNVAVGAANLLRFRLTAICRTIGDGSLLRYAVVDGHFEHVSSSIEFQVFQLKEKQLCDDKCQVPAVFHFHLAAARVDVAVGTANGFRRFPAHLLAVARRLAMLLGCPYYSLPVHFKNDSNETSRVP